MADISTYVAQIEVASRGEDVRDAIISALEAINDGSAWSGDDVPTEGSTHPITSGGAYNALARKQDKLTFDSTPAQNSPNPVTSGGIYEALQNVAGHIELDDEPTEGSTNAVTSGGVYEALQDVSVEMDETPTSGSEKAVKSRGIYQALRNIHLLVRKVSVTLGTTWEGDGPYSQTVTIANISANDKVDIQPGADVLHQLIADGTRALWIENDDGVLTAYCMGNAPSVEMTIQCTVESVADADLYDTLTAIQTALAGKQNRIWTTTIRLQNTWQGDDPYTQVISIPGATANSMIDLMPGLDTQAVLFSDGVTAIYIDNDNGVFTVTAVGGKPSAALSMPILVTELSTEPAGSGQTQGGSGEPQPGS